MKKMNYLVSDWLRRNSATSGQKSSPAISFSLFCVLAVKLAKLSSELLLIGALLGFFELAKCETERYWPFLSRARVFWNQT